MPEVQAQGVGHKSSRPREGAWDQRWRVVDHPLGRRVLARDLTIPCFICDQPGEATEVEHLIEVADGGSNDLTNLASCHRSLP